MWETATHPRLEGRMVDPSRVRWALQRAVGTRDFAALHAQSSVRRPRTLERVGWWEQDGVVEVALRGDAFGRYGVRLLVGGAVLVAAGLAAEGTWSARSRCHHVRGASCARGGPHALGEWATPSGSTRSPASLRGFRECRRSCLWIRPGAARP